MRLPSPLALASALALVLAFLAGGPARAQAAEKAPLVMCTRDYPPLFTKDHTGLLDMIVLEAFRRVGQPVTLVAVPSERALINANTGVADGDVNRVAGMSRLYPNLVQVPEPTLPYEFMIFTKKPMAMGGWEGLKPLRVGIVTGWKILEENVHAASLTRVDTPEHLFALLAADRVDVAIYEHWIGEHLVREQGLAGIRALDPPLERRDMFMYLNARHAALVPRLAAALKAMKADGTHGAIVARFKGR